MTSAHRPTFDHAKGKDNKSLSSISHKRGLPSHTKLKFRTKKRKINTEFEEEDGTENTGDGRKLEGVEGEDIAGLVEDLKSEVVSGESRNNMTKSIEITEEERNAEKNDEANVEENDEHNSDEESEEDSDDEEALLLEMERIKKEREEVKRKEEEAEIEKRAKQSNPLMLIDADSKPEMLKKKSWRDRKTMAKKVADNNEKKFLNDTVKSDFHKKFLDKYVR